MTIIQLLKKYSNLEIELLLVHTLRKSKEFLYMHPHYKLRFNELTNLKKYLARREKGEPIAYIVGYKYFYGLKFKVNKHVLIPRPETEWLVERACALVESYKVHKVKSRGVSILDVGTGSGCIPLSIASQIKDLGIPITITASDISEKALTVAETNAKANHTPIRFIKSDLFKNIPGKFDIITANLPYVPHGMYELLYENLQYEPKHALTDGTEVWELYDRFLSGAPKHLKPHGTILLEIDDGGKSHLQKIICQKFPTASTKFHKDIHGLWRYVIIADKSRL